MTKTRLLFLTILIEGYVVLACELLAIRQLIPFVGSGVEVVAIVISGVLLPLALGYHAGGTAYKRAALHARKRGRAFRSIRKILFRNVLLALFILVFGLSYLFLEIFFGTLAQIGVEHRLGQTALYTLLFLVAPVFLLGQTVPLVSNYFSRHKLSEITGKMLFFSTAGAFLGSIFSTLVLMTTIGVHNTVIVTLGLLAMLCFLLRRGAGRGAMAGVVLAVLFLAAFNNNWIMKAGRIVSDDAYNTARVVPVPKENGVVLQLNNSVSALLAEDADKKLDYTNYVERHFIQTMPKEDGPRDILVIGAGGFSIGLSDTFNHYIFVDIDPAMKDIAEDKFLHRKLTKNKKFVVASARAFLVHDDKRYDLIVVDVAQQRISVPMECMTQEFLEDVKRHMKVDGILAVNMASSPDFRDKFSVRYDRTFSKIFPVHTRQVIDPPTVLWSGGVYNPWGKGHPGNPDLDLRNNLYIYFNRAGVSDATVYTDDKNTYSIDRP